MDITISSFVNPFSFFCKVGSDAEKKIQLAGRNLNHTSKVAIPNQHGQYVAVLHENKWVRGVVSVEQQFLIWLVDYGVYLRPDENIIYMDLPAEYKTLPTKVFEASIHGVSPVDKVMTDDCDIANEITTEWTRGATARCLELIDEASKVVFVPVALLSTTFNDIVIGNLYLKLGKRFENIIDQLELWPVFLERNEEHYIQCLKTYYGSHRKHRANKLKPELPNKFKVPSMTVATSLAEYSVICAAAPQIDVEDASSSDSTENTASADGTVVDTYGPRIKTEKDFTHYQLTPAEEKEYDTCITLAGKDYNFLKLIRGKLEDFKTCEKYKDIKYIGRATGRRPQKENYQLL